MPTPALGRAQAHLAAQKLQLLKLVLRDQGLPKDIGTVIILQFWGRYDIKWRVEARQAQQ